MEPVKEDRKFTIFLDIDGCILPHYDYVVDKSLDILWEDWTKQLDVWVTPQIVRDARTKCTEWHIAGYNIILTTGRPEMLRRITEEILLKARIFYNQLVMNCGPGPRVLINDTSDVAKPKAFAISLERNKGLSEVNLDQL